MIYFDNNASTPLAKEVKDEMTDCLDIFGNPSSVHLEGQRAKHVLDTARRRVAELIGARPDEIIFTSGGTESDNLAILGYLNCNPVTAAVTSAIEHSASLNTFLSAGAAGREIRILGCDENGTVCGYEDIFDNLNPGLVSVMLVNNETGVVQPVKEIAEAAKKRGFAVHSDAVQGLGKMPVNVRELGVDMLSLSSHKIHGPKGIGALYIRRGTKIAPLMNGGGQESFLRSGTENVLAAAGFGKACELAGKFIPDEGLRDVFEARLQAEVCDVTVNGACGKRVGNTSNVRFAGVKNDALTARLDMEGIAVSAASACRTLKQDVSHVLKAMGLAAGAAGESVRFSFSRYNTEDEVISAVTAIKETVESLRRRI